MPDPFEKAIEQLMEGRNVSRRQFARSAGASALALSSAGALLSACGGTEGTDKGGDASQEVQVSHPKTPISELKFSNWIEYVDPKVLKEFEKRNGGKVKYVEDINDNDEFNGKVQEALRRGRSIKRDLAVLTDWMAARWIRAGWVEAIDKKNVPNARNLEPTLASPKFDPKRQYTMPWQSGMTAIGYNRKKTGRDLTSVKDLFDPKFKGRVTMLTEWRDSAGLVLLGEGKRTEEATRDDVLASIETIEKESSKGQIRRFTGNDYVSGFQRGDLWVVVAYSGDVLQATADNPDLKFIVPDEGALLWTDNMLMPQKPPSPYAAETMMNYVYEPAVAAKLAAAINYVSPVKGAKEELAKTDPKLAENELIFPTDETRKKLQLYPQLALEEEREVTEAMQRVTGA